MAIPQYRGPLGFGLDPTPIRYDTNAPVVNYSSPGWYNNFNLTQEAVRHPDSGYIQDGKQVVNPHYYRDPETGQIKFLPALERNRPQDVVGPSAPVLDAPVQGPNEPPGTPSQNDIMAMTQNPSLYNGTAALNTPTHTMPDGTVHPGATHEDYLAMQAIEPNLPGRNPNQVVADQLNQNFPNAQSILQRAQEMQTPITDKASETDKKRNRTSFGEMLMDRLNTADPGMMTGAEKLMRAGGEIVGASEQGTLAAMQAAGQSYGAIQDYERAQRQQQIENTLAEQTKAGALTGKQQADLTGEIGTYKNQIAMLDDVLTQIGDRDDITGPIAGTVGMKANRADIGLPGYNYDKSSEYRQATGALQLMMQDLKVKGILDNTKNTKGAISDKEMKLFASGVPVIGIDQEGVWKSWLQERRDAYARIVYRLENGIRIDPSTGQIISQNNQAYTGKQPKEVEYTTITETTTNGSNYTVSPEIEAEFNNI